MMLFLDRGPQPDRSPYLTDQEYFIIQYLKSKDSQASYSIIYKRAISMIDRLAFFNKDWLKSAYKEKEKRSFFLVENLNIAFCSQHFQKNILDMVKSPNLYLMNHSIPYFKDKNPRIWTIEENDLLQKVMPFFGEKPNFILLSICFPGRTGKQIYNHYLSGIQNGLFHVATFKEEQTFDPNLKRYFLPKKEIELSKEIIKAFKKGRHVTEQFIREKAIRFYKLPWILAERAAYQHFSKSSLQIYIDDDKKKYTDEFLSFVEQIRCRLGNGLCETRENVINEIIKEYELPKIIFSSQWVRSFLKRNRLSRHKGHFSRRGKIDQTYAKIFVNQVARAILKYGWNKVFNVDESSVRINNGSKTSIAPIGTETVVVDKDRNDKECFTIFGTCNINEGLPLIIVSKGKTNKSKLKFKVGKNTKIILSQNQNGWTNEAVMLEYLEYFHNHFQGNGDCALILDCLAAHRTPAVLEKANSLKIELIFVPANGTAIYQPLDRRLFGILKSKLRSMAGSTTLSGKSRYEEITKNLLEAWDSIKNNEKALTSAWNIPNLYDTVFEKAQKIENTDLDEYNLTDFFDDEEEESIENVEEEEEEEELYEDDIENDEDDVYF